MPPEEMRKCQSRQRESQMQRPGETTRYISRALRSGVSNCASCWAEDSWDAKTENLRNAGASWSSSWKVTLTRVDKVVGDEFREVRRGRIMCDL